jgi:hypothetical protein
VPRVPESPLRNSGNYISTTAPPSRLPFLLLPSSSIIHSTHHQHNIHPRTSSSHFQLSNSPKFQFQPTSINMPPKGAAEKKPATKAPATKAPAEKKDAGKKTAATGEKKKRTKTRKETYSSYIYKGMRRRPDSCDPSRVIYASITLDCHLFHASSSSIIGTRSQIESLLTLIYSP